MLARQKVLLKLISESGGKMTRMRLVKLAFLYAQDSAGGPPAAAYQFLPYRFGPFSFTLYHELGRLTDGGCLQALSRHDLSLPTAYDWGETALQADIAARVRRINQEYGGLSTSALIDLTHERYPWNRGSRRPIQSASRAGSISTNTDAHGLWLPRSKRRHRSRFAARQAAVLISRQSRHSPEQ